VTVPRYVFVSIGGVVRVVDLLSGYTPPTPGQFATTPFATTPFGGSS
jgi:hypothetical protein